MIKNVRQALAREEEGISAVLMSVILVGLLGMTALVLDVGRLYVERRELQNGATAAVIAIAEECARGLCGGGYDANAKAEQYIDSNAKDGAANLFDINFDTSAGRIDVTSSTETTGGGNILLPLLGQVIGYEGTEVAADASAIWGPLDGEIATLPIIFSECEWVRSEPDDPAPVPLPGWPDGDGDTGGPYLYNENLQGIPPAVDPFWGTPIGDIPPYAVLRFHEGTNSADDCNAQAGQDYDEDGRLSGGFGWLDTAGNCTPLIASDGWVPSDPGSSPSTGCSAADVEALLFIDGYVFIPYFDDLRGVGAGGEFHVLDRGAFYVIGYNFGGQYKNYRYPLTSVPCTGQTRCIAGYFYSAVYDGGTVGSGGGGHGVSTYQLIG